MAAAVEDSEDEITGINVTPMVDIVLVLLIIFMVTAPIMSRRALQLTLPKAAHADTLASKTVRITLSADGSMSLDGRTLERDAVGVSLKQLVALDPELRVSIAADQKVPWGEVSGVLDDVKEAGCKRVAAEVRARNSRG